jgi:hypothetical protein
MSTAEQPRHVSGWYGKDKLTKEEEEARRRQAEEWYDRRIALNYRQIALEAPGKMVLALGRLAQERNVPFGQFVEDILADYLAREGIDWKQA